MIFRQIVFLRLFFFLGVIFLSEASFAERDSINLRFPVFYNPNPIAGRLYIQPLDVHDARVVSGTMVDLDYGSSTDYNIHFVENEGDEELTVNSTIFSLRVSHGFSALGRIVETGGIIRTHQDMRETWFSNFVKNYHQAFPSDGFGNVPEDGQYYGAVGNNETVVIGDNREFFLTTLQLYAKYQFLYDDGPEGAIPDLTVKCSTRIPLSSNSFDRPGMAVSAGVSKEIITRFHLIGTGGLAYQDLDEKDFNAENMDVEQLTMDLFAGVLWDLGERGGWYSQIGMRWSSERVSYPANSESADPAYVVHGGVVYRKELKNDNILEFYGSFNEDIPGLGHGLEPDVAFYAGVSYHIR